MDCHVSHIPRGKTHKTHIPNRTQRTENVKPSLPIPVIRPGNSPQEKNPPTLSNGSLQNTLERQVCPSRIAALLQQQGRRPLALGKEPARARGSRSLPTTRDHLHYHCNKTGSGSESAADFGHILQAPITHPNLLGGGSGDRVCPAACWGPVLQHRHLPSHIPT